jgi:hypothetical protein
VPVALWDVGRGVYIYLYIYTEITCILKNNIYIENMR